MSRTSFITVTCRGCRESVAVASKSDMISIQIPHARTCEILLAMEEGRGRRWIAEHGSPIEISKIGGGKA